MTGAEGTVRGVTAAETELGSLTPTVRNAADRAVTEKV
jgi:hypothetical protein